jgi:signal transduction histidine kinase
MAAAVKLQVARRMEAEASARMVALSESKVRREAQERERLVRDLHDRTIQSLLAVNATLERCAQGAGMADSRNLREALNEAAMDLDAAIGEVRDGVLRLGPEVERHVSFRASVADWLSRLNRGRHAALHVGCDPKLDEAIPLRVHEELLGIVREAVSNALRHGQAERVAINLRVEGVHAVLEVQDDGAGFDPAKQSQGQGLPHLRQRASELGGEFSVDSRPGGPTLLRVRFPLG